MTEKLSIAWWNTSLSPKAELRKADTQRGTRGATAEERNIALQVILHLLSTEEIDFLALGEIAQEDILVFQKDSRLDNYMIESGVSKIGHIAFDTCFIYRSDKITNTSIDYIDKGLAGKNLKIAQKLTLQVTITSQPFYLFISHWASRLNNPQNSPNRDSLGILLRQQVDDVLEQNEKAFILLLGDYNDEPFDKSLAEQVMATRDKLRVKTKRKQNLLYNPFWQYLSYLNANLDYAGTYYYKSGDMTQWHTFDQIIVSSAFLTRELQLSEAKTGIVHIPTYLTQVKDRKTIFDHLPVKATIQKV